MKKEHRALIALLVIGATSYTAFMWRQSPSFEAQDPHYREGPIVGEHAPSQPKPSQPARHTQLTTPAKPQAQQNLQSAQTQERAQPQTAPLPPLPPLPQEGWSIKERGALAAPIDLARAALAQDLTWDEEASGGWRHIAGGATLTLSTLREGRLTGVTLRFEREGGASAVIPPLEALLLGSGEPSMLRWERNPGEPAPPVGGRLTHRDTAEEANERSMYYYCEYPSPQGDEPLLPHTCHFTLEPHPQALKLGEALQPLPSF